MTRLKQLLFEEKGQTAAVEEYFAIFPESNTHNHPLGGQVFILLILRMLQFCTIQRFLFWQVAKVRERIDPGVVNKISELQRIGVSSVAEVGRHLRGSSKIELGGRRKFTPRNKDVQNLLYSEKNSKRYAFDDQQNLVKFCENFQKEHPDDSLFIRVSRLFTCIILWLTLSCVY